MKHWNRERIKKRVTEKEMEEICIGVNKNQGRLK